MSSDEIGRSRLRRQGHRLGIFLVALSFVVLLAGFAYGSGSRPGERELVFALGFLGMIFGYPIARLWYWFKSA